MGQNRHFRMIPVNETVTIRFLNIFFMQYTGFREPLSACIRTRFGTTFSHCAIYHTARCREDVERQKKAATTTTTTTLCAVLAECGVG